MKTRLIYNAKDEIDASITVGFLQSHGVEAYTGGATVPIGHIADEAAPTHLPQGVYVPDRDSKKAKRLLRGRGRQKVRKTTEASARRVFFGLFAAVIVVFILVIILRK